MENPETKITVKRQDGWEVVLSEHSRVSLQPALEVNGARKVYVMRFENHGKVEEVCVTERAAQALVDCFGAVGIHADHNEDLTPKSEIGFRWRLVPEAAQA